MGREIRKVPKNWNHPRDKRGNLQPMFDEVYEEVADRWVARCIAWANRDIAKLKEFGQWIGTDAADAERIFREHPYFWQWTDNPPNPDYYRMKWDSPAECYQIYENVSEGTPVSPVFETKAEMAQWLVDQGHSEDAAARFIEAEWAMSMMICTTADGQQKIYSDIDTHEPNKCGEGKEDADAR